MAKKLWGGRFKKKIDKDFFEFQKSINYDYRLAKYDIMHSLIHAAALEETGILSKSEKNKIIKALKGILKKIKGGKFKYDKASEDIHTDIQNKVEKKVGKLALKLHTLRSRNDQIVFDEKFYCHVKASDISEQLEGLLEAISFLVKKYKKVRIVGYTHTQRAQAVSFPDYMNAFLYMLKRDQKRIANFKKSIKIYVGSGALAGSSIRKNQYNKAIEESMGFLLKNDIFSVKAYVNSLDSISDRDFIIEFLSIIAIAQMHLSRLAEDFILYSTKEFNFFNLPEEFCTGSSLMPQKKNPDFLELVRGYTGKIYGNLISILTMMKGLPLTYNRDMQLDKEPLFSSVSILQNELKIMAKFIRKVKLNTDIIKEALKDEQLYATKRADKLVREQNIPFREAHDIVGRAIKKQENDA